MCTGTRTSKHNIPRMSLLLITHVCTHNLRQPTCSDSVHLASSPGFPVFLAARKAGKPGNEAKWRLGSLPGLHRRRPVSHPTVHTSQHCRTRVASDSAGREGVRN